MTDREYMDYTMCLNDASSDDDIAHITLYASQLVEMIEAVNISRISEISEIIDTMDLSKDSDVFRFRTVLKQYLQNQNSQTNYKTKQNIILLIDMLWDKSETIQKYSIGTLIRVSVDLRRINETYYLHRCIVVELITKIFNNKHGIDVEMYLDLIESHTDNGYDDVMIHITGTMINSSKLDGPTLKIVLRKIIESFTYNKGYMHRSDIEMTIENLLILLNIDDIDRIFAGDLPFSRSLLVDQSDRLFDVLETVAKLTVLGCTGSVSFALDHTKRSNKHLIQNLINVAKRYHNNETHNMLQNILNPQQESKSSLNSHTYQCPHCFSIQQSDVSHQLSRSSEEQSYAYFDLFLLCITLRIHCIDTDTSFFSGCNIM